MAVPETVARSQLISLLQTEFAVEQFPVRDDKLHASIGVSGTELGVYPDRSAVSSRNNDVAQIELVVQFYGIFDAKVDPQQSVSPSKIEGFAERFRNRLRTGDPNTDSVWYFQLRDVTYPDDPTGNKTRFEAHVTAVGLNTALRETTG